MEEHVAREIGSRTFTYGKHTVEVSISIHTGSYPVLNHGSSLSKYTEGIHRKVSVCASFESDPEITNSAYVKLDCPVRPYMSDYLISLFSAENAESISVARHGSPVPSVETHVEAVLQPVLTRLDEIYKYTDVRHNIDVRTTLDRAESRISWADVESELERLVDSAQTAEQTAIEPVSPEPMSASD
jgi:hypothetical protein